MKNHLYDFTEILKLYPGLKGIKNGCKGIYEYCHDLEELHVRGLNKIDSTAMKNLSKLKSLTVFYACSRSLDLPKSIESIILKEGDECEFLIPEDATMKHLEMVLIHGKKDVVRDLSSTAWRTLETLKLINVLNMKVLKLRSDMEMLRSIELENCPSLSGINFTISKANHLVNFEITTLAIENLELPEEMPQLKNLKINCCKIQKLTLPETFPSLEHLYFSNFDNCPAALQLESSKSLISLKLLKIAGLIRIIFPQTSTSLESVEIYQEGALEVVGINEIARNVKNVSMSAEPLRELKASVKRRKYDLDKKGISIV